MDTEVAATVSSAARNMSPGWRVHCARHELTAVNPMTTEVEIPIPTGVAKEEREGGRIIPSDAIARMEREALENSRRKTGRCSGASELPQPSG